MFESMERLRADGGGTAPEKPESQPEPKIERVLPDRSQRRELSDEERSNERKKYADHILSRLSASLKEGTRETKAVVTGTRKSAGKAIKRGTEIIRTLKEKAGKDFLTGLDNRAAFEEKIAAMITRVNGKHTEHTREGKVKHLCVLMLDIDRFKKINDTLGHDVGDQVLKYVAGKLKEFTGRRATDLLARWGGEEFMIAFEGAEAGTVLAGRFQRRERDGKPPIEVLGFEVPLDNGRKITVTFSGGIIDYTPGETLPDLRKKADRALYAAKKERNGILKFDPTMPEVPKMQSKRR